MPEQSLPMGAHRKGHRQFRTRECPSLFKPTGEQRIL
jgi:hypothetical protein